MLMAMKVVQVSMPTRIDDCPEWATSHGGGSILTNIRVNSLTHFKFCPELAAKLVWLTPALCPLEIRKPPSVPHTMDAEQSVGQWHHDHNGGYISNRPQLQILIKRHQRCILCVCCWTHRHYPVKRKLCHVREKIMLPDLS
jgi:hypothetical protein